MTSNCKIMKVNLSFLLLLVAVSAASAAAAAIDVKERSALGVIEGVINSEVVQEIEDVPHRVQFFLYTQKSSEKDKLFIDDEKELTNSKFDPARETKFIIHGWIDSENSESCTTIKDALIKAGDFNVIIVDWSSISQEPYSYSALHVPGVAKQTAKMIDFLVDHGMDLNTTSIIGHSLGAHIAGLASQYAKAKVNYIVGLDPALPLFYTSGPDERISSEDARNVEIIHTNAGFLGFEKPLGKADFYINGGTTQLGCGVDLLGSCAHQRSFRYFAESILSTTGFYGRECLDEQQLNSKLCKGQIAKMGGLRRNLPYKGIYYVITNSKAPFATGTTLL